MLFLFNFYSYMKIIESSFDFTYNKTLGFITDSKNKLVILISHSNRTQIVFQMQKKVGRRQCWKQKKPSNQSQNVMSFCLSPVQWCLQNMFLSNSSSSKKQLLKGPIFYILWTRLLLQQPPWWAKQKERLSKKVVSWSILNTVERERPWARAKWQTCAINYRSALADHSS